IEAIGFPALKNFLPVLEDAVLIRGPGKTEPMVPEKASLPGLLQGFHHSDLVRVQGKLLYRSLQQLRTGSSSDDTPNTKILTLQDGVHIFSVEPPDTAEFAGLTSIPIGSTLAVSGICSLQTDDGGRIVAVHILLRDPSDIGVLKLPPWWTPGRLLAGLGIL